MKKTILLLTILTLTFVNLQSQISPAHIYFQTDKHKLDKEAKSELEAFLASEVREEGSLIEIVGHTDDVGEMDYNLQLAFRRANSVKDFLIKAGIAEDEILVAALGEANPIADNAHAEGRQLNRRVSLAMGDGSFAWLGPDASTILSEEDVLDMNPREQAFTSMVSNLRKKGRRYKIQHHREYRIRTLNGSLIFIPAQSLETEDGSAIEEDIEFEVNEFASRSDMIMGHLHSISDRGLLETGGMLEINAFSGDKKLKLKEGRKIEVYIPTAEKKEDMQLFTLRNDRETELSFPVWELDTTWDTPDTSRIFTKDELWWVNKNKSNEPDWDKLSGDESFLYQQYDTTWQGGNAVIIAKESGYRKARPSLSAFQVRRKPYFYRFNVGRLGWINCDRFIYDDSPKSQLLVKLEDEEQPYVLSLVFKGINSIMNVNHREGAYQGFKDIPLDQELTLIAMTKGEEEGKWKYTIQDIDFQKETRLDDLAFVEASKKEMEAEIATKLDR